MIIGTTPDITALQGTSPAAANASVRPSQHGTEFARILAAMTKSLPYDDQNALQQRALETQAGSDLSESEDDLACIAEMDDTPGSMGQEIASMDNSIESMGQELAVAHDLHAPAITPSIDGDMDTPALLAQHLPDVALSTPTNSGESAIPLGHAPSSLPIPPGGGAAHAG